MPLSNLPDGEKIQRLGELFRSLGSVLVCYSGGVDSAFVLAVAHRVLGEKAIALTAVSPSLASFEREAAVAFADEAKRRALNAITHPRISALSMDRAAELATKGEPLACYEAALIVENGMADAFRPLVVVAAPEALQLARAVARDGGTPEDALARIRAQKPLAAKVALADHVIHNAGTRDELTARADQVLDAICASHGIDPGRYAKP